jgi:hypothetical protein
MRAYHFVGDRLRDGRPVPANGVTLKHDGPLVMCQSGLHFSRHPFDALRYAPGPILCLVECGGTVIDGFGSDKDKGVCSERTIIARIDATEMLRYFARMQALSVIHLWDAPQTVCDYLMTGKESIRAAAGDKARDTVGPAAMSAAWAASTCAVAAAVEAAAWAAAGDAERNDFALLVDECFYGATQ